MVKKILFAVIEIHEESFEVITSLEKRLIESKVSHRIAFKRYGIIEVTLELPQDSIIARGQRKLLITIYTPTEGDIIIPVSCIDSIEIELRNALK